MCSLWKLVMGGRLPAQVLGNRTTSMPSEDAYGVWHSHEPEKIIRFLSEHHLVRARSI